MQPNNILTQPDEDLPSDAFFVEQHVADAMPSAHWHDHIEVNYLPRGKMDYLLNGRRVTLQPRRLGVFWAAIHHQAIEVEAQQKLFCAYIPISDFLGLGLDPAFRAAILHGQLVQSAVDSTSDEVRLMEIIEGWAASSAALRQIHREEILLRVRRLSHEPTTSVAFDAALGPEVGVRSVRHVEQMTAYIAENLGRGLTVGDVAAAAGLHPTSARSAFRRVLGISVGQYIRRQRLSHAMRLLAETDQEIAQIAHLAGYSSLPRLYDAFQQNVGKTPRRFRQDIKGHAPRRK